MKKGEESNEKKKKARLRRGCIKPPSQSREKSAGRKVAP